MSRTEFPDNRLSTENKTRQCQLVQLRLLKVFDSICRSHNLKYFLDFGTLLGAKRHGGAIPWDDDADVSMPIDDYNRFQTIAKSELPSDIVLQGPTSDGGALLPFISRLRDTRSFFMDSMTCAKLPSGIFLDIYPIQEDPKHFFALHKRIRKLIAISWATECVHKQQLHQTHGKFFYHWGMLFAWHITIKSFFILDRALSIFGTSGFSHAPVATRIPCNLSKELLFPLGKITFEGTEFSAPHNVEGVLTKYFGDWKKLPPPHRRTGGHCLLLLPTQAPHEQNIMGSYFNEELDGEPPCEQ